MPWGEHIRDKVREQPYQCERVRNLSKSTSYHRRVRIQDRPQYLREASYIFLRGLFRFLQPSRKVLQLGQNRLLWQLMQIQRTFLSIHNSRLQQHP